MTKLIIIHATCKDKIIRNLKATHEVVSILSVNGDNHKKQLQVGFFKKKSWINTVKLNDSFVLYNFEEKTLTKVAISTDWCSSIFSSSWISEILFLIFIWKKVFEFSKIKIKKGYINPWCSTLLQKDSVFNKRDILVLNKPK